MGPKKGKKKSNKKNNQGDTGGGGGDDSIPPTPIEGESPAPGELPDTPIDQTGDFNEKPNGTTDLGDVPDTIRDLEKDADAIRSGDEQEKDKPAEPTDPTVLPEESLDGVEKAPADGDQVDQSKSQDQPENQDEAPQLVSEEAPAAVDHVPDTAEPEAAGVDEAHASAPEEKPENEKPEEEKPEEAKPEDLADAAPETATEEAAAAPEAAPTEETPAEVAQETALETAPEETLEAAPVESAEAAQEGAPDVSPEVAQDTAPEGALEATHEGAPEVAPEAAADVSEAAPDTTAEGAPEEAVEATAPEEAVVEAAAAAPEVTQEAPQEAAESAEQTAPEPKADEHAANEVPPAVATPPVENAISSLKSLSSSNPNFSASRYLSIHSPTFTGRPHHTVDSSHDLDSRNMTSSFNNWYNKVYTLADSLEFSKGWPDVEAFDHFAGALDQPFKQISMWPPEEFFARKPREEDAEPLEGEDLKYEQFWEWKSKIALAAFCSNFAAREVMGRQLFALTPDKVKRLGSAMFVFAKDLEDEVMATRFRQMTIKLLFESTSYKKAVHKELLHLSKELGNVISSVTQLLPPPAESGDKPPADPASALNSMIMTTIGTPSVVLHNTIQKDPVYFALYHPTPGQAFEEDLMEETTFNGMGQGRGDVGFICRPGLIRMGFPKYGESHDIGVVVKARVLREAAIEWEP